MLKEFAVEPAAAARSSRDFNQIIDLFGFHRGRAIAPCPNDWADELAGLLRNADGIPDVRRQALLAKLARMRPALFFPSRRSWPNAGAWADRAHRENYVRPFQAVLASEARDARNWLVVPEQIDLDHECLAASTTDRIAQTSTALAACAASLIRASRQVILVDPYFDPFLDRFRSVLRQLLAIVAEKGRQPDRLEYHLSQKPSGRRNRYLTHDDFQRGCSGELHGVIPAGLSVTFVRWRERNGGEDLHGRYILTEKAALRFDAGLDAGRQGQTTAVNWEPPLEHQDRVPLRGVAGLIQLVLRHWPVVGQPVMSAKLTAASSPV